MFKLFDYVYNLFKCMAINTFKIKRNSKNVRDHRLLSSVTMSLSNSYGN